MMRVQPWTANTWKYQLLAMTPRSKIKNHSIVVGTDRIISYKQTFQSLSSQTGAHPYLTNKCHSRGYKCCSFIVYALFIWDSVNIGQIQFELKKKLRADARKTVQFSNTKVKYKNHQYNITYIYVNNIKYRRTQFLTMF